ncbi:MAG: glycosyltransferase [Novosphingobium sp.]
MTAPSIVVISDIDPLTNRLGSTQYLDAVISMFHDSGAKLRLVVTGLHGPAVLRVPRGAFGHYARHFDEVRLYRAVTIGDHIYSTDPLQWLDFLRRKLGGMPQQKRTWLGPVDRARARWAVSEIQSMRPDLILCNYFNTVPIASDVTPDTAIAVLMHDLVDARRRSFLSRGLKPDFDETIVGAERTNLGKADLCIAIKPTDAESLARLCPQVPAVTVPMTLDRIPFRPKEAKDPVALFVGGGFEANVNGLAWAMTEVWPKVRAQLPGARLRVVGKVADAPGLPWPEGTERVGFVDELADEYAGARVVIAPLFIGSGMKIKVVEALGHGVHVITTACGAEGLEDIAPHFMAVTDNADHFAQLLTQALQGNEPEEQRKARHEFAQARFSRSAVQAKLLGAVEALRHKTQE